jgi:antiviral helicase SKI2
MKMNTVDALIGTELIFENVLAPLTPEEIVSVLSCLVFQEKSEQKPSLIERLEAVFQLLILSFLPSGK